MTTPQLNNALFNQALELIREGDMRRARALGFSNEELQSLSRLRASEIESMIHEFPGVARFELDHEMFRAALRRIDRDQDRDELVDQCIRHGASVQMLAAFFGLTPNDCSARRALLGVPSRQGRLPMPDESVEHAAWHRWQTISSDPASPASAEDIRGMLVLAEEVELPLAVIWTLIRQWTTPEQARQESVPGDDEGVMRVGVA
ncbi:MULTISPECIES: DUF2857 domain-containing protein [unclassified Modicisalibacter]|uniref:DUF2857 domain-containing protein n=1 Tax=unclassified Modicisalibacter TaxID=2679913 RepID=UPI001CC8F6EC|nr:MULTISPECIES: DUF2857 domain-containing protein [unclassified Modicisalibacter]MBZ9559037.1 DUF2857 domain-containing protein [Modicisalibacter sp. R2A 31.J]MBZ9576851.1 DUF2857 domain-containing protein [Modicisalibacter sp. MOD 31.J]